MPDYYSFDGIKFGPLIQDSVPMVSSGELTQGERHVPGSNYNIIDLGGRLSDRYASRIRVAPADVSAMEARKGQSKPLVLAGVSYPSALLLKLAGHTMTPGGEWHMFDAEWSLVDNVLGVLSP